MREYADGWLSRGTRTLITETLGLTMVRNGERGKCPACRAALGAPSAAPLERRDCPRCGAELWVVGFSGGPMFFPRRPGEAVSDLLAELAGPRLGFSAEELEAALKGADSFDVVELLSEVEDALWQPRVEGGNSGKAERDGS